MEQGTQNQKVLFSLKGKTPNLKYSWFSIGAKLKYNLMETGANLNTKTANRTRTKSLRLSKKSTNWPAFPPHPPSPSPATKSQQVCWLFLPLPAQTEKSTNTITTIATSVDWVSASPRLKVAPGRAPQTASAWPQIDKQCQGVPRWPHDNHRKPQENMHVPQIQPCFGAQLIQG